MCNLAETMWSSWYVLATVAVALVACPVPAAAADTSKALVLDLLPHGAIRRLGAARLPPRGWGGGVAVSPDGRRSAVSEGGNIILFKDQNGRNLHTLGTAYRHDITALGFSPDGTMLAASDTDARVELYDITTWEMLWRLEGHSSTVTGFAFAPDGRTLVTASSDRTLLLWNLSGRRLRRFTGHRDDVTAVAFVGRGKRLVSGSLDGTLRLWDVDTGKELRSIRPGPAEVRALVLTPDGKGVIAEGPGHCLCQFDLGTGREVRRYAGHSRPVIGLALAREGKTLASSAADGTIRLWNVATGKEVRRIRQAGPPARSLAFLPDGTALAAASENSLIDLRVPAPSIPRQEPPGHRIPLQSVAFSPDGRVLLTRAGGQTWHWDAARGKLLRKVKDNPQPLTTVIKARSPDGRLTVSVFRNSAYLVLAEPDLKPDPDLKQFGAKAIRALAFSPDSRFLATGSVDGVIRGWDVTCWEQVFEMQGNKAAVTCLAFSPDGRHLLSGSEDTTAILWDLATCAIRPGPLGRVMSDAELDELWGLLGRVPARPAHEATWILSTVPAKTLSLVKRYLPSRPDVPRLTKWIRDLDADNFAVRERASDALAKLGLRAVPLLRQTLLNKPPLEVRYRIERLLAKINENDPDTVRLWCRVIVMLERMRSPEARSLLEAIAISVPGESVTRNAWEALARMERTQIRKR